MSGPSVAVAPTPKMETSQRKSRPSPLLAKAGIITTQSDGYPNQRNTQQRPVLNAVIADLRIDRIRPHHTGLLVARTASDIQRMGRITLNSYQHISLIMKFYSC